MTDKEIEQLAIIEYPEYDINEMEEYYNIIRRVAFKKGYKAALQSGEARPLNERHIREVSERIYNKLQSKGIVNTSVWVINEVLDTYFNIKKPDAQVKEVDVEEILYQNGDIVSKTPALSIDLQQPIKEGEDTPKPFTGEMWCFLLANSLRCLTEEQRAGLCFDLYGRSIIRESIDSRIKELRKPSEEGEELRKKINQLLIWIDKYTVPPTIEEVKEKIMEIILSDAIIIDENSSDEDIKRFAKNLFKK